MVISLYRDLDNLAWETPIFLLSRFNFKLFSISLSDPMLDKWAIFVERQIRHFTSLYASSKVSWKVELLAEAHVSYAYILRVKWGVT